MSPEEHKCTQEKTLGELVEANKNFKEFMHDIKDNHLKSIYTKLEIIADKMSSRRPSWSVLWIITTLTTICGILITEFIMRK